MKITLKDRKYDLDNREVAFNKKIVSSYIHAVRQNYNDNASHRLYVVFLIVIMVMAEECLEQYSEADFDIILGNGEKT